MNRYLSIILAGLVVMSLTAGCGSPNMMIRTGPDPEKEGLGLANEVLVAGAAGWQRSGVSFKKNTQFVITSSGLWKAGATFPDCGPDGYSRQGINSRYDSDCEFAMALIGRINDGKPFLIGSYLSQTADADGELELRCNDPDAFLFDNTGGVNIRVYLPVKHQASPPLVIQAQESVQTQQAQAPAARPVTQDTSPGIAGMAVNSQNWAVIVGISEYQDSRIPSLRYASRDAESFYNWAVSKDGGRFAPSRVKVLLDKDATAKNIKEALFSWLKQALEEDMVTIYFAGHGSPESPDSPDNLYLLPYDVNYDGISSTGFPMWDIETALKRFIKAKKVVVIADACHAGGVGQSFDVARRSARNIEVNQIETGIQSLSKVGDGVCVITASDDKQYSQEGQKWGGGHGVFTYFLLEGLGGSADYNHDGKVTLGELIPYLSEQVRRETGNAQSPNVAGKFDPALSIGK